MEKIDITKLPQSNKAETLAKIRKYLHINHILGIDKTIFWIYFGFFLLSIATTLPSLFIQNTLTSIGMSFGSGTTAAIFLAYFLELRAEKIKVREDVKVHNETLNNIYLAAYSICKSPRPLIQTNEMNDKLLPLLKGREEFDKQRFQSIEHEINKYLVRFGNRVDKHLKSDMIRIIKQTSSFEEEFAKLDSAETILNATDSVKMFYCLLMKGIPERFEQIIDENFLLRHWLG